MASGCGEIYRSKNYIFNHNHDCYRIDLECLKHIAPVLEKNSESIITKISLKNRHKLLREKAGEAKGDDEILSAHLCILSLFKPVVGLCSVFCRKFL